MADADVEEIDSFITADKRLIGPPPEWGQHYARDWTSRWGIINNLNIQVGELAFSCDSLLTRPSVVVLCQRRPLYRLDIVLASEVKPNPFGAYKLGLPPTVTGSHTHSWQDNREWVRLNGFGELPFRRPTAKALRTLEHMLATVSDAINLELSTEQRDFRLPRQPELF